MKPPEFFVMEMCWNDVSVCSAVRCARYGLPALKTETGRAELLALHGKIVAGKKIVCQFTNYVNFADFIPHIFHGFHT